MLLYYLTLTTVSATSTDLILYHHITIIWVKFDCKDELQYSTMYKLIKYKKNHHTYTYITI
ncbi:unnamed protein product [Acanthoscelides obtectus]|uniref:Uncharacterized protein n=1 Tax=Acanthoscelides obtectus TaxID=200917 RepID=A0A9P0MEF9_ACAOB|nr:unnamed protein product [Acanthoscelides obtectus]CAK1642510.1 hypothetical protein AOBTE_LOCUS13080 [Acanthoscelides obtectus]